MIFPFQLLFESVSWIFPSGLYGKVFWQSYMIAIIVLNGTVTFSIGTRILQKLKHFEMDNIELLEQPLLTSILSDIKCLTMQLMVLTPVVYISVLFMVLGLFLTSICVDTYFWLNVLIRIIEAISFILLLFTK